MIFLQEYFLLEGVSLDAIEAASFFDKDGSVNMSGFLLWLQDKLPLDATRAEVLVPNYAEFDWDNYSGALTERLNVIALKVNSEPLIYGKRASTVEGKESKAKSLMDVFFEEGILPTYSFPRNVVRFFIDKENGIGIEQSPERALDIALSEYAPGRLLVVNKKSYISGGIYDHYTKYSKEYKFAAAEPWLEIKDYYKDVYCCDNKNCGWFGMKAKTLTCPLCSTACTKQKVVKPWGFAPQNGRNISETRDQQELSYISQPSYSSMLEKTDSMLDIGKSGLMRMEKRADQ